MAIRFAFIKRCRSTSTTLVWDASPDRWIGANERLHCGTPTPTAFRSPLIPSIRAFRTSWPSGLVTHSGFSWTIPGVVALTLARSYLIPILLALKMDRWITTFFTDLLQNK